MLEYVEHTRRLDIETVKINGKTFKADPITVRFIPVGRNRFELKYKFNLTMNAKVKEMGGYHYHGFDENPRKVWSVLNNERTANVVKYYDRDEPNPFDRYKQPIIPAPVFRDTLYLAQREMIDFAYTKRFCHWACDMGLGKTLAAIHTIELTDPKSDVVWVGPRAALAAVKVEFNKWKPSFQPIYSTYQGLIKYIESMSIPPQCIVFDEGHKIKNGSAQCTQDAAFLASAIRQYWGDKGIVIVMTGTPAPKRPIDWYSQIETLYPGFIAEGSVDQFRRRLCAYKEEKYSSGVRVDKVLGWLDDGEKCKICAKPKDDICHPFDHLYVKSKNEIELLRQRLKPIVLAQSKKDYLDLPDKMYFEHKLPVDAEIKRWASLVVARANTTMQGMMMLRELSDGFLYDQEPNGKRPCPVCKGSAVETAWLAGEAEESEMIECPECAGLENDCVVCNGDGFIKKQDIQNSSTYTRIERECRTCKGTGEVDKMKRLVREIRTPKDDAIKEYLERNEDVGRMVVYCGFEGAIDRVTKVCLNQGWTVFRCDGRGMVGIDLDGSPIKGSLLEIFQDRSIDSIDKMVFVGNPEAGGIGITLTAACTTVFYSNSYKADARMQAEDRIHRMGMDENRGALIVDLLHLPEDYAVLNILKKNKDLQDLSMFEIEREINEALNLSVGDAAKIQ